MGACGRRAACAGRCRLAAVAGLGACLASFWPLAGGEGEGEREAEQALEGPELELELEQEAPLCGEGEPRNWSSRRAAPKRCSSN